MIRQKTMLYMCRGLPGSGKTTEAKKLIDENKKMIRLNKDDLREMLHFGGFNHVRERMVVEIEYQAVETAVLDGFSVIVDDTNLNPVHENKYRAIAAKYPWVTFEMVDLTTVPLETCIEHDQARKNAGGRYVGRDNIINMAFQFKLIKQERDCVVIDMDGTLSDPTHRRDLVYVPKDNPTGKKSDWPSFFERCADDPPRDHVIDMLKKHKAIGREIILCSARPEFYDGHDGKKHCLRTVTVDWLKKYNIPFDRLIMRRQGDYRKDELVKSEILDKYLDRSRIVEIIDDRPIVINMWRSRGLEVQAVGSREAFPNDPFNDIIYPEEKKSAI